MKRKKKGHSDFQQGYVLLDAIIGIGIFSIFSIAVSASYASFVENDHRIQKRLESYLSDYNKHIDAQEIHFDEK
ncbi:hypothetical protein [Sediminispirochaeta bajacaliforniensis]|uniref:hypothetical protein n=1 Tax=Sediminispirochaeta bajacaliforniensis TaxID=148 RepID=UPI00036DAD63|nr:hypothetical protein [Sediminispirochaeta bajacaliforniensis]